MLKCQKGVEPSRSSLPGVVPSNGVLTLYVKFQVLEGLRASLLTRIAEFCHGDVGDWKSLTQSFVHWEVTPCSRPIPVREATSFLSPSLFLVPPVTSLVDSRIFPWIM